MLDTVLSPIDFYNLTLEANGVKPTEMDLVKIAAAEQKPVEVVKLAKAYYEQSQIDGIQFESEGARKESSYKIAEAFFEQIKQGEAEATKVADGIVRFLKHAAEGYLAQNQLELTPEEALKIAGLQITDAESGDLPLGLLPALIEEPKTAAPATPAATPEATKTALGEPLSPQQTYSNVATPSAASANLMTAAQHINGAAPANIQHAAQIVHMGLGLPGEASLEGSMRGLHQYHLTASQLKSMGHNPLHQDVVGAMRAAGGGQPGFVSRNAVPLAIGGLGLGAMYLMHRKHQAEQDRQEATNRALRAAAMPAA